MGWSSREGHSANLPRRFFLVTTIHEGCAKGLFLLGIKDFVLVLPSIGEGWV